MKQNKHLSTVFCTCFFFALVISSCKKGPGEGGTSAITGKIFARNFNNVGTLIDSYYISEERVYIIYGDADFYGNDTRTGYDGTYRFDYLRKGSYTIYAYSNCDSCASGTEAVKVIAEITDNNSVVTIPDIIVRK